MQGKGSPGIRLGPILTVLNAVQHQVSVSCSLGTEMTLPSLLYLQSVKYNPSVLTPQLIVVCAAAGLSTAVAGLAEVAAGTVGPWAVAGAAQERQGPRAVVLHTLKQGVAPPEQPLLLFLHDCCCGNTNQHPPCCLLGIRTSEKNRKDNWVSWL